MSKWQKAYYRGMARTCMVQCLYFSDGNSLGLQILISGKIQAKEASQDYIKTCLDLLRQSQMELQKFKGKQVRLLQLKNLTSVCVLSIKVGDSEFAESNRQDLLDFLSSQKDSNQRNFEIKAAIKMVLDVLSIENFGDPSDSELASVYSWVCNEKKEGLDLLMQGIKFELVDHYDKAVECLNEATIKFKSEKNFPLMYVTLGHLITIHQEDDEYVRKLSMIHQGVAQNLDSSADFLQEYLEKKIELAKDLVRLLLELEGDSQEEDSQDIHKNQVFSKLAVKLSLSKTLNKLKNGRGPKDEKILEMIESLEQMKADLDDPKSDMIMKGVGNHSYVSTSVHRLKNAVINIHNALKLFLYGKPFNLIKKVKPTQQPNPPPPFPVNKISFTPFKDPIKVDSVQFQQIR